MLTISLALFFGPILLLIYKKFLRSWGWVFSLCLQKNIVVAITASYAFTMLGFLATLMAILLSAHSTYKMKRYKSNKYWDCLISYIKVTIGILCSIFIFSLLSLAKENFIIWFYLTLIAVIDSLVLIGMITVIIVNLISKSSNGHQT